MQTADRVELSPGISIRMVSAVGFVATKLEAFRDRGGGDFLSSHDIEDVLNVVDGRAGLADELSAAPPELRQATAAEFRRLIEHADFSNVLPGLLAEPERTDLVMQRLRRMMA